MRATLFSRVASASPAVSISVALAFAPTPPAPFLESSPNLRGLGSHMVFRDHVSAITTSPTNTHFVPADQEIVRCDERGSTGTPGQACRCKVCMAEAGVTPPPCDF